MVNPFAGEAALVINGKRRVLKLTLGALVELEAALGADSLVALVERFENGRFRAGDVLKVLLAGLYGGGEPMTAEELLQAEIEGGAIAAAQAAAAVLARAFGLPEAWRAE